MKAQNRLDRLFWDERYRQGKPGWDIGEAAPPLVDFLDGRISGLETPTPTSGRCLVAGCGRGHDALWLAGQGFEVVGIDFAPSAIQFCREQAEAAGLSEHATFEVADFFKLPSSFTGTFDCAVEHTLFCAINPTLRPAYVEAMHRLLKPNGLLIAIFFAHKRQGGPPYRTDAAEVRRLFAPHFEIHYLEPVARSHPGRQGEELFGLLKNLDE